MRPETLNGDCMLSMKVFFCRFFPPRKWRFLLLIVLVICGLYWIFHKKAPNPAPLLAQVVVSESHATDINQDLHVNGHTQAKRTVTLRAEVRGRVQGILAQKGTPVTLNQEILLLSEEDRPTRLEEAKARLKQREKEFLSGRHLKMKSFQSENTLVSQEADLAGAKANLAAIEKDIKNTHVTAPFSGIFENQFVEVGHFVNVGDQLATIVELDPLLVVCYVSENEIPSLKEDCAVEVRIPILNKTLPGKVYYQSHSADPKTRTFCVEVAIDNPHHEIPDGMTAEVVLSKGSTKGHKILPSYISLDDKGIVGVKTVEEGKVVFYPVTVLNATPEVIWVSGLPEAADIITVGADFVVAGQQVVANRETKNP